MKALYFDCFSGISGDMTLGALIDLGIDKDVFLSELGKLNLAGYEIVIEKKASNEIIGTDVHVILVEEHVSDSHTHSHHGHEHSHSHSHSHPERNLKNIEDLIDLSDLKQSIKNFSKKVFKEVATAEAKVHNKDINEVHFHEVGAIDSIVDIVGVAICLDLLGIEKVFSSPLHDGNGFIECRHGMLPVPVPAVMEMLVDSHIPYIIEDVNTELVTPTGMALIKCLTSDFGNMPAMIVDKVGYGMGKRETGRFNALRVVMGNLFGEDSILEEIAILETNIDNMSPEVLGYTMERLMENGALDVFYTPIYMKKNRPAVILTVLAKKEHEKKLVDIILRETSTLGVRRNTSARYCLNREIVKVNTEFGNVRVKIASGQDFKKFAPEYEDCREIAIKSGVPLIQIYHEVQKQMEG